MDIVNALVTQTMSAAQAKEITQAANMMNAAVEILQESNAQAAYQAVGKGNNIDIRA